MHYNLRQAGVSRYFEPAPHSTLNHVPIESPAEAVLYWPARHFIAIGLLLILILSVATSGIYWKASQLASFTYTPSPKPKIAETIKVPAMAELAVPEPVPPPPAPVSDAGLNSIISTWIANHPSVDWSIVVSGLGEDSRFADYNANQKRGLASIYKLFMMYPLFQKVSLENFATTQINYDSNYYQLDYCADAMLRYSHNECGVAVGRYVGWSSADKQLNNLGFNKTELYSDNGTQSSASDTAKLLKQLYNGNMFTDAQRQYIINILKKQTKRSGIPAGCSGCEVANKTGSLSYINNDAGIVYYASENYVLVIFTDGAGFDSIANLTAQIQDYLRS